MIRNDNVIPFPDDLADAMRRHPAGKGRPAIAAAPSIDPVFLSRFIVCPLCEQGIHDGDHEALYTKEADGTEVYVMTGHRACITAEVDRRNGVTA